MFITGPDVIKTVTGEDVTMEELGGAHTHMAKSGTLHYVASGEQDAFDWVRDLLSYLPPNNFTDPPREAVLHPEGPIEENLTDEDLELDTLIPDSPNQPYDMHEVITRILDEDEFLEIQAGYAQNIVVGFGRIDGRPVGIVANQPTQFAGCLDINASEKAARFVRTCDCYNIPIVMLVDVPGFLPGTGQEYNGIIRRGAKLLFAYGEATVPKITVITRKAYGGAYCVMGSKDMGCDVNIAWPTAQIAVMGASGAVGFVYRKQLSEAANGGQRRRRAAAAAAAGVRGHTGQPVRRRRARIRRRGDPAVLYPRLHRYGAAPAGTQDHPPTAEEAREHSAMTDGTQPQPPARAAHPDPQGTTHRRRAGRPDRRAGQRRRRSRAGPTPEVALGTAGGQAAVRGLQLSASHPAGTATHAAMTRLVLGSASPGRLKVLRQAGVDPLVVVSGVDEDEVVAATGADASPVQSSGTLAQAKADQVAARPGPRVTADCVVIGCDSMLYSDGRLVGKPHRRTPARSQWRSMSGRSGSAVHRALPAAAAGR